MVIVATNFEQLLEALLNLHTAVAKSDTPLACSSEYCLRSDHPGVLLGCRRGAFSDSSIVGGCSEETNEHLLSQSPVV